MNYLRGELQPPYIHINIDIYIYIYAHYMHIYIERKPVEFTRI